MIAGLVVISSCGHAGIINTLRRAQEVSGVEKIYALVGGFPPRPGAGRLSAAGHGRAEEIRSRACPADALQRAMNLRLARSVDIAMVAKAGGYDALYVDMQHAPYSIETTATICAAALGIGITPLVRVPNHDGQWMSRVLDGGAQGVILPDVNTRAQAEAIVAAGAGFRRSANAR